MIITCRRGWSLCKPRPATWLPAELLLGSSLRMGPCSSLGASGRSPNPFAARHFVGDGPPSPPRRFSANLARRPHPHGAEDDPPINALGAGRTSSRPPRVFKRARARASKPKSASLSLCAQLAWCRSLHPRRVDSSFT